MIRLTEEHVAGFIYLMDQIIKYDLDSISENVYETIVEKGKYIDNKVHPRTISRAFNLRENLKKGEIIKQDYNRPELKTLNVLTAYNFEHKIKRFRLFEKKHQENIKIYYEDHKPSNKILEKIFGKKPPKIEHLQNREDKLSLLLDELNGLSLEEFLENWIDKKLKEPEKKNAKSSRMKSKLLHFIEYSLDQAIKKKRKALFIYRFFGSFFLFFLSIDYGEVNKETVMNDFMGSYDNFDNDIFDDIIG